MTDVDAYGNPTDTTVTAPAEVRLVGVAVPFWDLVVLLIKLAFAAVPAGVVMAVAYFAALAVLGGIGGAP